MRQSYGMVDGEVQTAASAVNIETEVGAQHQSNAIHKCQTADPTATTEASDVSEEKEEAALRRASADCWWRHTGQKNIMTYYTWVDEI